MKWPMRLKVERQARLMNAMMDRLGVEPIDAARAAGGTGLAAASRRCVMCSADAACARWLESTASGTAAAVPPFCPNGSFFESVRSTAPWR